MNKNVIIPQSILLNVKVSDQEDLFNLISKEAIKLKRVVNGHELDIVAAFENREDEGSTGFEQGFAIPHAQSEFILEPTIFVVRLANEIEWETFDEQPVKIAIALLVPADQRSSKHLMMLSTIAEKLMDEDFQQQLKQLKTKQEIIDLINL